MIRYTLLCRDGHTFESWFGDSAAFDRLAEHGQLLCPACGSSDIRKALMAPSVARGATAPSPDTAVPVANPTEPDEPRALRDRIRALHRAVTANAEDVGRAFPEEARRIHEGEAARRSIYGQANGAEVKALLEDGVPLLPLPTLPDSHH